MTNEGGGLSRALNAGDSVILSTGATATTRRSYPAGYAGEIEILLDGSEETERTDGLTLPTWDVPAAASVQGESGLDAAHNSGEARGPSLRMED